MFNILRKDQMRKEKNTMRSKIYGAMLIGLVMMMSFNLTAFASEKVETDLVIEEVPEMEVNMDTDEVVQTDMQESLKEFDNTLERMPVYGSTINTYLSRTDKGYQEVLVNEEIHILDYDEHGKLFSHKKLDFELPVFGGYYSGDNYNYFVYGKAVSYEEDEIYRIIKYDKNFNRIKALSVFYKECYTAVPFDAGNVSIAEKGKYMTIYTARTRPDGHQSNIALSINTDSMTIEDTNGMSSFPDIHVSHSLRQIVKYDGENPVYTDLGDAHPRAVCIQQKPGEYTNMLSVAGEIGANVTRTDVSGMEITDTGYLVVGTQVHNDVNNIYLSYVERGKNVAQVKWLTNSIFYNVSDVCNAKIVKVSKDVFAVMWNCFDNGGSVNYVMVNGQGETISGLKSLAGAQLTQCEPVLDNGRIIWNQYVNGKRDMFSLTDLNCTGIFKIEDNYVPAKEAWDGKQDISWYEESKTEFVLTTPQQMAGLAQLVNNGNTFENKKILLGKDMFFNESSSFTYEWTPIASVSSAVYFQGTFDGQGHTLYNLNTYTADSAEGGLFGVIGEKGIVKAVQISQSRMCEAAIADENYGWILFCENNSLVENVHELEHVAGICSINRNLVYGCGNTGIVRGIGASGIVGANYAEVATIDSCWNQGIVKGSGFEVSGIVGPNWGWVYDCYNAGSICGSIINKNEQVNYAKTVTGIIGQYADSKEKMYNCYHRGFLDIPEYSWYCSDTICGEGKEYCENMYSTASPYNSSTEVTLDELKSEDMVSKIQGEKIIPKWCMDELNLNNGYITPIAQQDMKKGVYKILPDVWNAKTEVTIKIEDGTYQLEAFEYAYYGIKHAKAVYSSDSDILSVSQDGMITPYRAGTAFVQVTFPETEHTKKVNYNVKIVISGSTASTGDSNSGLKPNNPTSDWQFGDVAVKPGNWKYEAVKYVTENGIMNGTAPNEFKPDDSLTRAMFATMLYRMAGQPAVTFTNKFPDVSANKWYSNAVIWASEKGIVVGYGDGRFGTNDFITREQIAKMLMQFGKVQGYDVSQSADFSSFADASSVSGWATSYMKWAVGSGMIGGKTIDGKLCIAPKGNATRAESATMLMRFMEKY